MSTTLILRVTKSVWPFCLTGEHEQCSAEARIVRGELNRCPCDCHQWPDPPPEQPALTEAEAQLVIGAIPLQALPEQPAREADDHELRKQALIATAEFIADDRRWQELRDGGAICKSHELAVLVTHVNDGEPCSDYLHDAPAARKAGVE